MEIIVTVKSVYGNDLCYPVCEKAQLFARLTGQKTFSPSHLKKIQALGYTVRCEGFSGVLAA